MTKQEFVRICPECEVEFTTTCRTRIMCGKLECRQAHSVKMYKSKRERKADNCKIENSELKERKCLKCDKLFGSEGPGNRLCPICQAQNFKHTEDKSYCISTTG